MEKTHLFINTREGIFKMPVLDTIRANDRLICIHNYLNSNEIIEERYVASDYLTGMAIRESFSRNEIKILAKETIEKNANYDFASHPVINCDDFLNAREFIHNQLDGKLTTESLSGMLTAIHEIAKRSSKDKKGVWTLEKRKKDGK